ncbi:hypothetical protein JO84_gp326 [Aureococcus anophagefferens virus]|uniref:Uncharacterized protein n=1 Tax=Aureococcus anophagefferens virus TaxID=1474867 RepID=A0A076FHR3_9VIRU|nr:hypothetical protein JO84_gp326 [Aureococcus anophagefferens virus]AII16966.1 hypothetical protein AaV_147 [Aureococcus anophagefferens virus]UOG94062.1 hypothetical protein MKD35_20 [Aureococcus anophagefferens virus]
MDISKISFIHFLTSALVIECFIIFLFKFTKSPFSGRSINNWYTNFGWSAVILDVLSLIIGFYLAKYAYMFLLKKNVISKKYALLTFLIIMLLIQIVHDFTFYFTVIKPHKTGKNAIMDELQSYANKVSYGAVIGDSFMYLLATPLLYFLIQMETEENTFISLVSAYIIGYILYQKPIV